MLWKNYFSQKGGKCISFSLFLRKGEKREMWYCVPLYFIDLCHLMARRRVRALLPRVSTHSRHTLRCARANTSSHGPSVVLQLASLQLSHNIWMFLQLGQSSLYAAVYQKALGFWIGLWRFGFGLKAHHRQTCVEHYSVCVDFEAPPRYM